MTERADDRLECVRLAVAGAQPCRLSAGCLGLFERPAENAGVECLLGRGVQREHPLTGSAGRQWLLGLQTGDPTAADAAL